MRVNENLRVRWSHSPKTRETVCQILDNTDKVIVAGIARAFHTDHFCKSKGRNASLTKALNSENNHGVKKLDRPMRTEIWTVVKTNHVKLY